jgi:putative NADH-flavin reductase
MHLTIFGATGQTGLELVSQAVAAGHEVTAVIREGASAADLGSARVVVVGNVMDPDAIVPTLAGSDAVISAIGARNTGPTSVCHDSARSISMAARAAAVPRLVVVSSALVTFAGDGLVVRTVIKPVIRTLLRHIVADASRMESYLRHQTDLEWTIVRPPRLTSGRRTGRYRVARESNPAGGFVISRADLAGAMLDMVGDRATVHAAIGVAK